jgi:hypothetical protein
MVSRLPLVVIWAVSLLAAATANKFYIYDWSHLVNRYANYSDRPHHGHGVEFPQWRLNYGAGRLIDSNSSEYKTSQFALFKLLYERALVDPNRTLDPEKAVSFFIPYDFGMDATFIEANGRMRRTQCPLSEQVLSLLLASPHFRKNGGHDHTLVVAVNQNMNYFFNAQPCMNVFQVCWNCTKVSIDEYMFIAKDRKFELKKRGINWHAVPFPADYHYAGTHLSGPDQLSTAPWERPSKHENRSIVVSFLGNPRKYSQVNTAIREALVAQCMNHTDYCSHGAYKHDATISGPNGESRRAVFCLQPPGDMPTRKSVFDSILSGCIPVLFHPLTARYMYEWHLGQEGWEKVAVNYDTQEENKALVGHSVDFIAKLHDMYVNQPEVIGQKRQYIRDLAHQLQFSLIRWNNATDRAEVQLKRAANGDIVPDAYDVTMRQLLRIHSGKASHARTSEYLSCAQLPNSPAQTSDDCSTLRTLKDPYAPPSVVSPLYHV